jgi:hypothetical protein
METNELIQASATIASALVTKSYSAGDVSPERIQEIARHAVALARAIEKEARRSEPPIRDA